MREGEKLLRSVSQLHVMLQFHLPAHTLYKALVAQFNYDINETQLQAEKHQETLLKGKFRK